MSATEIITIPIIDPAIIILRNFVDMISLYLINHYAN